MQNDIKASGDIITGCQSGFFWFFESMLYKLRAAPLLSAAPAVYAPLRSALNRRPPDACSAPLQVFAIRASTLRFGRRKTTVHRTVCAALLAHTCCLAKCLSICASKLAHLLSRTPEGRTPYGKSLYTKIGAVMV